MPEESPKTKGRTHDPFEAAAAAWEALVTANEALNAVGETQSREWVLAGLRVVKRRAKAYLHELEAVLKENSEE
jgi:hypothetical protein